MKIFFRLRIYLFGFRPFIEINKNVLLYFYCKNKLQNGIFFLSSDTFILVCFERNTGLSIIFILFQDFLRFLVTYHRFISFCLYIIGFVGFVLSLVNKYYMKQFSLFAWTHVALLIVVTQSYLIIQNIFEGLIW